MVPLNHRKSFWLNLLTGVTKHWISSWICCFSCSFLSLSSPPALRDDSPGVMHSSNAQEGTMGISYSSVTKCWFPCKYHDHVKIIATRKIIRGDLLCQIRSDVRCEMAHYPVAVGSSQWLVQLSKGVWKRADDEKLQEFLGNNNPGTPFILAM